MKRHEIFQKIRRRSRLSRPFQLVSCRVLGALSYPLLTAQLRRCLWRLPLELHSSFSTLLMVLLALGASLLQEALNADSPACGAALGVLLLNLLRASWQLLTEAIRNRGRRAQSAVGTGLHFWVRERDPKVASLEARKGWKEL